MAFTPHPDEVRVNFGFTAVRLSLPVNRPHFSLSSLQGGEGRGEEVL